MDLLHFFDLSLVDRRDSVGLEIQSGSSSLTTLTFGELEIRSNQWAHFFHQQGLIQGDRLCVYLPSGLDFLLAYLACIKLGAFLFRSMSFTRSVRLLELSRMRNRARSWPGQSISSTVPVWDPAQSRTKASQMPSHRLPLKLDEDAPAAIIYTSGTTGTPKGAVLTRKNFATNATTLLSFWQIDSADRFLLSLPLFHVHGLGNGLHCWLFSGCRLRLWEKFERDKAESTFLGFRPTLFFGVPTIYVYLLELPFEYLPGNRSTHAIICFRFGSAVRGSIFRVSQEIRASHFGTLRHDRNFNDHQQPLCRRAPAGNSRLALCLA